MANAKKNTYFTRMIKRADGNPRTLYKFVNKELDRKQAKPLPSDTTNHFELAQRLIHSSKKRLRKLDLV